MSGTIKDIAYAANVSIATVSLALNNKPGISETTRKKILDITKSINPELFQKKITTIRTGTIRFLKIIKHGHVLNRDHDVFISSYIDGLQFEAKKNGFNLEVNSYKTSDIDEILDQVTTSPLNGIIVLGTELNDKDLKPFESLRKPVVIIDTNFNFMKLDFVNMNNTEALYRIIRYLTKYGHKEIGLITSPVDVRNIELRRIAFKKAMNYFNLRPRNDFIFSVDSTYEGAYTDMLRILKNGATIPPAIFASNDIIAYGCIKAFKEQGNKVPGEISIIGFDNLPMCAFMDPPLTTINVSKKQIGKIAMRTIINRINNDFNAPSIIISISGELIERNSVKRLYT